MLVGVIKTKLLVVVMDFLVLLHNLDLLIKRVVVDMVEQVGMKVPRMLVDLLMDLVVVLVVHGVLVL